MILRHVSAESNNGRMPRETLVSGKETQHDLGHSNIETDVEKHHTIL